MQLTWADYAIGIIIAISTLISLLRGFMREAISLATWIVAFWCAFRFYGKLDSVLTPIIHHTTLRVITSYAAIFLVILVLGALFNFGFALLVAKTGLSSTDRVLGMAFGFIRGVLLIAVVILLVASTGFAEDLWFKNAQLIPHFKGIIMWLQNFLPAKFMSIADNFLV